MSMLSVFPNNAAETRQFDPASATPKSKSQDGDRTARFDTVMQHVLRRPERDAEDGERSNASDRPPATSDSVRRKRRSQPVTDTVSDATADTDGDQDGTAQARQSHGISGTLENSGL